MLTGNHSAAAVFVFVNLTQQPENLGMILLIAVNPLLHTPMFYILSSLSFTDLCYSTVITLKMLVNFLREKNMIIYSDCYLLIDVAYGLSVVICSPLIYSMIMSSWLCSMLVLVAFILELLSAVAFTSTMMKLSFCKSHITSYYFSAALCYAFIFWSIIQIQFSVGSSKAPGTSSSCLISVGIFFGSTNFMYFKEKTSSVFYTTVIPMLNPLTYSLRNKNVKKALVEFLGR
uniref:G-protein coupled receptors family 1 profile domain-containing protein n=1 Tax=Jaculus jaculus TaxID=51337 RepID=A0A8C5K0C1_JACJA